MKIPILCVLAFQELLTGGPSYNDRFTRREFNTRVETCVEIAHRGEQMGLDPILVAAVGLKESKFNPDAVSPAGALGALQVLPQYHCPGRKAKGCDLIAAGLGNLKKLLAKYGDEREALCHYNAGYRCGKTAYRYADKILRDRASWRDHFLFVFLRKYCNIQM